MESSHLTKMLKIFKKNSDNIYIKGTDMCKFIFDVLQNWDN